MAKEKIASRLVAVVSAPLAKAVFDWATELELVPLTHWGLDALSAAVVSYVVTLAGAVIATIRNPRSAGTRWTLIGVGLIVLLASYGGYAWAAANPPPAEGTWVFDSLAVGCYVLTALAFGFVIARIVKHLLQ